MYSEQKNSKKTELINYFYIFVKINKMKVFLIIIFLNSCVSFSQNLAFRADLIPANLKENANSVIRLQNISVELKSQTKYIEKTQKIITVFNQNGPSFINFTFMSAPKTPV